MSYPVPQVQSSPVDLRNFSDVRFLGPSKYASRCIFCENPVSVGEMVYWVPKIAVMHESCLSNTAVMGRRILDQSTGGHLCPICWSPSTSSDMFHPACLAGYVTYRSGLPPVGRSQPFVSVRAYRTTIAPTLPSTVAAGPPTDAAGNAEITTTPGFSGTAVYVKFNRVLGRDDVLHALQDSALAPFIDPGNVLIVQGES